MRFPGQYEDAETGLYYNRYRYYKPNIGRYLRVDPIGLAGGMNPYVYVSNNPGNWVDPYGLFEIALTPYAVAIAPGVAMLDSPFLPFADAIAGSLIGIAYLHDTWPDDVPELNDNSGGSCPNGDDDQNDKNLTDSPQKIAKKLGQSREEIKDAIHKVKENMHRSGPTRNPNVSVNIKTGEVYPQTPGGGTGDSIGNIFDHLTRCSSFFCNILKLLNAEKAVILLTSNNFIKL